VLISDLKLPTPVMSISEAMKTFSSPITACLYDIPSGPLAILYVIDGISAYLTRNSLAVLTGGFNLWSLWDNIHMSQAVPGILGMADTY